ncbi:MAG: helix-turn-helix transcriptional regulator [Bacteroidales bacterium]
MINWNIRPVFKARSIEKPYTFLVKAGISPHTATSILNSTSKTLRTTHLEILCEKLNCTPNDLLQWTPNKDNPLPDTHALNRLKHNPAASDIGQKLKSLPLEKLNEIAAFISGQQSPEE